uniref:AT24389p (inferred by orthology to a D. melanogaster protein) n=1 Tax=Strongyloides venezuelensis TaxID=75913 RepID=A0A0K0FGN5_STRVS
MKGGMLTLNKNACAVFFWRSLNIAHGAMLNYCNRSGKAGSGDDVCLMTGFACATTVGIGTVLSLNHIVENMKLSPLINRFVPSIDSSIAVSTNMMIMRRREFIEDIAVKDENNVILGRSTVAAKWAIGTVVLSRILMAAPYMLLSPVIMDAISKTKFYNRNRWVSELVQYFSNLCYSVYLCLYRMWCFSSKWGNLCLVIGTRTTGENFKTF